jgi:hypothetical protein
MPPVLRNKVEGSHTPLLLARQPTSQAKIDKERDGLQHMPRRKPLTNKNVLRLQISVKKSCAMKGLETLDQMRGERAAELKRDARACGTMRFEKGVKGYNWLVFLNDPGYAPLAIGAAKMVEIFAEGGDSLKIFQSLDLGAGVAAGLGGPCANLF